MADHRPLNFELPPEHVTNGQLYLLLQQMDVKMNVHALRQKETFEQVKKLEEDTAQMREIWKTGAGVIRFIKLLAAIAAACGIVYLAFFSVFQGVKTWLSS